MGAILAMLFEKGFNILATGAVLAFIEFLIKRHDEKKDKKDGVRAELSGLKAALESVKSEISKKFSKMERDELRTQMLVLMMIRPKEKQEILTVAERYFGELHGNWYMTDMFNKWLEEEGHSRPEWFDAEK